MWSLYVENATAQAVINIVLILGAMVVTTVVCMSPSRKGRTQHPLFGRYTRYVPNVMSILRFPLAAWMLVVHFIPDLQSPLWNLSLHFAFWYAAFFDFLDGAFARKWAAITEGGKSLDPASDKFVTLCLALCGALFGVEMPWWAIGILVGREVASMLQRARMARLGRDVSARWLGKLKTGVQFGVLYIVVLRLGELPGTVGLDHLVRLVPASAVLWGVILMCFCTVVSLFPFFEQFGYVNAYSQDRSRDPARPWYLVAIPNAFTIGNYLCGVTAVYFAMPGVDVLYRPFVILFWIMAAAFCDGLDGTIARKLNVSSELGDCLDASTDLSTFGLSVGVAIFALYTAMDVHVVFAALLAFVYFWSVHLRLARFSKLQATETGGKAKPDFVGLPSPSGGFGVLVYLTLFHPVEHLPAPQVAVLSLLILGTSWFMCSKFDFISHGNALHNRFYKWVMIPGIFAGFGMECVLVFQQPFVSDRFAHDLLYYFRACSWTLAAIQTAYIIDGVRRGQAAPERLAVLKD